ncbi:tyrosine-protein phosphatase Lar isoform X1 [Vespula maculifrons]|uniref:Tyrosine-protein phosphatase Lar isoform X1 n=1 Tax=Vespula maculifrons TaxID=7453 RepID=A0ABD2BJG6_VESMC
MYLSLYFIFSTHDRFTTVAESQSRYLVHTYEHGALLRIEPVKTARDSTTYECVAENGVGDAVSAEAQLTVYEGKGKGKRKKKFRCPVDGHKTGVKTFRYTLLSDFMKTMLAIFLG